MTGERQFPLIRAFGLTVVAVLALGALALWGAFDRAAERFALGEGRRLNLLTAQMVTNTLGRPFADAAAKLDGFDRDRLLAAPQTPAFRRDIRAIAAGLPVLKAKLFAPSGLTLYSTDESNIGERKDPAAGPLARALGGASDIELVFGKTLVDMNGQRVTVDAIGAYAPIIVDGRVIGVLEVYSDISTILDHTRALMETLLLVIAVCAAAAFGALSLVIWRADRTIRAARIVAADAIQEREREQEARRVAEDENRRQADAQRQRQMRQVADALEENIQGVTVAVNDAAIHLQKSAQEMARLAQESAGRSATAIKASGLVGTEIVAVAGATENLIRNIDSISGWIESSSRIAADAVSQSEKTGRTIAGLSEAAQRIGEVVALINGVAAQTNLLALNATIEAARAGEAGKGFAVVANEVKALAAQTARATDDISTQINAIQTATAATVADIGRIETTIHDMSGMVGQIAAAAHAQQTASSLIRDHLRSARDSVSHVDADVEQASRTASATGDTAAGVLSMATALERQAGDLRGAVSGFLASVRAA